MDRIRYSPRPTTAAPADAGSEVRDAIARLGAERAELVTLIHWDGFTIAEAAEILGIPVTTARSRYRGARQELREALAIGDGDIADRVPASDSESRNGDLAVDSPAAPAPCR